jgi:hypothetical protein
LVFGPHAIAFTEPVLSELPIFLDRQPAVSIELAAIIPDRSREGFPFVFTLTNGNASTQLVLGQWQYSLILMSGTDFRDERREPRVTTDIETFIAEPTHVVITLGSTGAALYLNGVLAHRNPNFPFNKTGVDPPSRLVLGNSPVGSNPWQGTLMGFALTQDELSPATVQAHFKNWRETGVLTGPDPDSSILYYRFNDPLPDAGKDESGNSIDLQFPAHQSFVRKSLFESPGSDFRWDHSLLQDVLTNFLGFMPVGFVMAGALTQVRNQNLGRKVVLALIAGGLLSLSIEVGQAWIPTRDSNWLDWILNTIGAAGGALCFDVVFTRLKKHFDLPL